MIQLYSIFIRLGATRGCAIAFGLPESRLGDYDIYVSCSMDALVIRVHSYCGQ